MKSISFNWSVLRSCAVALLGGAVAVNAAGPIQFERPRIDAGLRNGSAAPNAPWPLATDLRRAASGANLIVEAVVEAAFPGTPLLGKATTNRTVQMGSIDDAVFRVTRHLKGCVLSPGVAVGRRPDGIPFQTGERYILFLMKHSDSREFPRRDPIQRYDLMNTHYVRQGPADGPMNWPLLVRVNAGVVRIISGNGRGSPAAQFWSAVDGTDAASFISQIAMYEKPPERCAERQAKAAAEREAERRKEAEKEVRRQAEKERKALEQAEKERRRLQK